MKINVPLPCNIEDKSLHLFSPYTSYEIEPFKVKYFKNVFVTFSGLALNNNGIIKETYHDYIDQHTICLNEVTSYYHQANSDPENLIDLENNNTYLLIHHPWYNYYHWLIEAITRLWLVKDKIEEMILLLPDYYGNSDFIMGSLKPFNINNYFFIPKYKSLFVKSVCIPQIKPICDSYDEKTLKDIREFYLSYINANKDISIDCGEKIYLSRKKAGRKKVINEEEVEKVVSKYGFTIVYNEDYSFLEQVSLYSNARYLISIHGSGLTNMLFMKENSYIYEIHKAKTNTLNHPSFVFWYQAAALGFQYYHQVSEPITLNDDYFFGDFEIDIELLDKNLALMCTNYH